MKEKPEGQIQVLTGPSGRREDACRLRAAFPPGPEPRVQLHDALSRGPTSRGLAPATAYHYSVANGPDHVFRTPPAAGTTFTVYVEGDIGDTTVYSRVGPVQKLIADGAPSFVIVVGDLTYGNDNGQ